jgi:hypothetical protein
MKTKKLIVINGRKLKSRKVEPEKEKLKNFLKEVFIKRTNQLRMGEK